ncbi:hypothetical protein J3R83DRAFT_2850 [Lanmaoa asiatica]|nr:hypothetical protein J3R83DRAFT_2850 [Lanmaoa asiatica]
MSCSTHARVFFVALCLVSIGIVFESLLVGELLLSQFMSRVLGHGPLQPIDASQLPILPNLDSAVPVPVETDDYTSVLLRAILNAPHSWELIVKGILHSLAFWAVVGATTLFHHIDQPPGPGAFDHMNAIPSPKNDLRHVKGLSTVGQHLSNFTTHVVSGTSSTPHRSCNKCLIWSRRAGWCSYVRTRRATRTSDVFHARASRSATAARRRVFRELVSPA